MLKIGKALKTKTWGYVFFILSVIGPVVLAYSSLYFNGYSTAEALKNVNNAITFVVFVLTSPTIWFVGSALMICFGELGKHARAKAIQEENDLLKDNNGSLVKKNEQLEVTVGSNRQTIDSLSEECDGLKRKLVKDHKAHVANWLTMVYHEANLNTHSRVSIYYVHDDSFFILARYSKNPVYCSVNAEKFPIDKGVLALTWQHKEHIDNTCPECKKSSKAYKKHISSTYGYDPKTLNQFRMKSCRYYGKAIVDADKNIGVILFESTSPSQLSQEYIDKANDYCEKHQSYMCLFIREMIQYNQSISESESLKTQQAASTIFEDVSRVKL